MIRLSRLDGTPFVMNADRIDTIEARPDTVITDVDGKHVVVKESVEEVVARVTAYERSIHQDCLRAFLRAKSQEIANG